MKYLGVDYGARWVGFALGDDETHMAMPLKTISYSTNDELFCECKKISEEVGCDKIIVGIPTFGVDGTYQKEKVFLFVQKLSERISCPIEVSDESFSSLEAQKRLRVQGKKKDDHAVAAMLILQGYLDKQVC